MKFEERVIVRIHCGSHRELAAAAAMKASFDFVGIVKEVVQKWVMLQNFFVIVIMCNWLYKCGM